MSRFLDKAAQKVKKKAGQAVDRFRPSPREGRDASTTSLRRSEPSVSQDLEIEAQPSTGAAVEAVAHSSMAPISVTIEPPELEERDTSNTMSRPSNTSSTILPSYSVAPYSPSQSPTPSIVNHTGNTTYNFGRDVFNNSHVNNYIALQTQEAVMKTIKSILGDNFVSEAADDEQPSYAGCMTGTRVGVLSKSIAWVTDDPLSIFWLAGMAGTGKTSIAVSLCRMMRKDAGVFFGGGYFCSRSTGSIARTDVRRIVPTLAILLAGQSQVFAEALVAALDSDPRVGHKPVADQVGPLLSRPLAVFASSTRPIVFVIDALDECSNERELVELFKAIVELECDAKVKFILTSRPEIHIRGSSISNPDHSSILHLHTVGSEEISSDIEVFIRTTLQSNAAETTWYTEDDIQLLVELSAGLFIFSSTVLMYVLEPDEDEDRGDRLRKATSVIVPNGTAATNTLDKVYGMVLTEASRPGVVDADELERTRLIVACILTARMPLSVEALAELLELRPSRVRGSLRRLHSLIHLPSSNADPNVRVLHASVSDFLLFRAPQHLRIAATLGHNTLACGCLRRMAWDDLCFNISRSRSSFDSNPKTLPDWIPLSLVYACLHWAHHIDAASDSSAFDEDVGRIFRRKFLFWLEVLSILGKVGAASGLLRIASSVVNAPAIAMFLRHANAFVASAHAVISRSAPHIYISALPFVAKESLVYRDFAPHSTGVVAVKAVGIDHHDDRLVATLTGHEGEINSVAYSPDGQLLASGSDDCTVRIWDTRTGEETLSPLRGNDGKVHSVAFDPDGQRVASGGEGKVIHVWSIVTGRPALHPICGHSSAVTSIAFSPNGEHIASASADMTIRLWSSETGQGISVMNGHTDYVTAVAFSPDGQLLTSVSQDRTARIWRHGKGPDAGYLLTEQAYPMRCVAISGDGKQMAAGSSKTNQAAIWSLDTTETSHMEIISQTPVSSLAFSPNCSRLALGGQKSIELWNPATGLEIPGTSFTGHSDWIYSISFSPSGLFIASGSADRTIRVWDAASSVDRKGQPLQVQGGSVYSVAISSADNFIVSGSIDHSVRIWDASIGEELMQPLRGHSGSIFCVAISPDGHLIASTSADQTIILWNSRTGASVGDPLRGHYGDVNVATFSPDSRWLASGSDDKTMCVWDVTTRQLAPFGHFRCNGMVPAVSFSPDGRLLAAGDSGGSTHLWWSGTNQCLRTLRASSKGIYSVAFAPNSTRIATGAKDGTVRVWDIEGGHQIFRFRGHSDLVRSVAYSPDARYLVSGSYDTTIRIWDAQKGEAIVTLFGHGDWVRTAAFTHDGQSIVSGSLDGTIHIWDVEAALFLPSMNNDDPLVRLGFAALDNDGWLLGPSGELLLWLPTDYRGHIPLPPCSMIIGTHRVAFTVKDGLHWGDQWQKCWRDSI